MVFVVVGLLVPVIQPKKADAQFVVEIGPVTQAIVSGVLGAGLPGQANVTTIPLLAAGEGCTQVIQRINSASDITGAVDTSVGAATEIIGGGVLESGKLTAQLAATITAKECVDAAILAISSTPGTSLLLSTELARLQDRYTKISVALQEQIENLKAQQKASVKDILKAIMIKVILNVSKNLTTEMVNKMVQKYKISDYLAYADAVSTQIYSMKYINEHYPEDARKQMMIRSILQSEKIPSKLKTVRAMADNIAQEYMSAGCGVTSTTGINGDVPTVSSSGSYINCLSVLGDPNSSSLYQYLKADGEAQETKAVADQATQDEMNQNLGFAPPRNCSNAIGQQQQIDSEYDQAFQERAIAVSVYNKLDSAFKSGATTQAELDKASASVASATAKVESLAKSSNKPVADICKAIETPAQFVATSVNNYLAKHFAESSQLKSENLPFFSGYIADVASNFLTNILTGKGANTSMIFNESGISALGGMGIELATAGSQNHTNSGDSDSGATSTQSIPTTSPPIIATDEQVNGTGNVLGESIILPRGAMPSLR